MQTWLGWRTADWVFGGLHVQPEMNLQREGDSGGHKLSGSRGNLLEIIWKSAGPKKNNPPYHQKKNPTKNKTKNPLILHLVRMIIFPFRHHHFRPLFLIFALPSALWIFRRAVWSHLEYDFMPVTRSDSTPGRLVGGTKHEKQKWSGLSSLSPRPSPSSKRRRRCFAEPWVHGRAGPRRASTRWMIPVASEHTHPACIWTTDLSAGDRPTAPLPAACPLLLHQYLV